MTDEIVYRNANHFAFEGEGVSGVIDTTSFAGEPTGSIAVDGGDPHRIAVTEASWGWTGEALVDEVEDAFTSTITVIVPHVHTETGGETFDGIAILVTHRSSFGGPALIKGVLESYEVRHVSGTAASVASVGGNAT